MSKSSASSQPGYAVQTLLSEANDESLRKLLGKEVIDALALLDRKLTNTENLKMVAQKLIDPRDLLRNDDLRGRLIDMLPLEKSRELSRGLGIRLSGDIYNALKGINPTTLKGAEDVFRKFFGIVEEDRAPELSHPTVSSVKPDFALFPHQRDAALRVFESLQDPPRKVVLHMPTGAGKTRTAMHVVARHLREKGETLVCWLAHSAELLEQAAEAFEEGWSHLGDRPVPIYRYWGQRQLDLKTVREGILVAGLVKLHASYRRKPNSLLSLGDRTSLTVIDEAHQAIAPTYRSVIEGLYAKQPRNALLGLTATPGRTWADIDEDAELSEFFDRNKVTLRVEGYKDPVSFLIDQGYLSRTIFRHLESQTMIEISRSEQEALERETDIPEIVLKRLGDDGRRNIEIVRAAEDLIRKHKRVLVFAPSVNSARLVTGILSARGHDAHLVTGVTEVGARRRIIRKFRSEAPHPVIVCNFGVLTTGFDAPNTSGAVIGRPTRSLVLYSQMVGRATRGPKAGGNDTAEIVTIVDTQLPGFGGIKDAFKNWEDVWHERG